MKTTLQGDTLVLSEIADLSAANAGAFREQARSSLQPGHRVLDVDLSQTRFLDSSGLGALITLHKTMCGRDGRLRVIRPAPQVLQILELTRLHRVFEIVAS
jgi:anti-sigma B factor antagonist